MKTTLALVAIIFVVARISGQSASAAAGPSSTSPEFATFADEYFDSRFASQPLLGTAAGFHQYDSKMPDLSRGAVEKRIAELKGWLARLQVLDRSKLTFDDTIDAAAIEGEIRSDL